MINKLSAHNLQKSYKGRTIISDVSFDVEVGEVVGILGPNGCGKTTSFYMVVGLTSIESGSLILNGEEISDLPMFERARRGIGYLPQESSIFRKLTVEENILSILELQKNLTRVQQLNRLEELIENFHITHIRKNLGMSLSGGERRRTEIARSLASNPKFVLFDEPFAGVDPISIDEITQMIRYLRKHDVGVLITDHNVEATLDTCDRSYVLGQGVVLAQGSKSEIYNSPLVRKYYLGNKVGTANTQ